MGVLACATVVLGLYWTPIIALRGPLDALFHRPLVRALAAFYSFGRGNSSR